jgi:hypothetical protein
MPRSSKAFERMPLSAVGLIESELVAPLGIEPSISLEYLHFLFVVGGLDRASSNDL